MQADVEAALAARGTTQRPGQYLDLVSLGGLIVAIATLAWTIYTDLRKKTPQPSPAVVARQVRMELSTGTTADGGAASAEETGQITQIIITEITRTTPPPS